MDNLTFEIIKRIVTNVGAVPDEAFGTRGLASSDLLLSKTLSVKYDDGKSSEHDIYSGKLNIDETELRSLLVNLSIDQTHEFLFVFRYGSMPIHAIKVVYGSPEDSFIRIYHDEEDKWILPSVYMKARLLGDFERFVSWGLLWNDCKENSDLYNIAVKLVD